jgi:hypothetical protein
MVAGSVCCASGTAVALKEAVRRWPRVGPDFPVRFGIAHAIALSLALHGALMGPIDFSPPPHGAPASTALKASFRPAPAPVAAAAGWIPEPAAARRPVDRPRGGAANPEVGSRDRTEVANAGTLERPRQRDEQAAVTPLKFDPAEYLTPREVDRLAEPVNAELFEMLPLSGDMTGQWLVRLYIDQAGRVNQIDIVESGGTERNAAELREVLAAGVFTPARKEDQPVKSQKMVELSFDPLFQQGLAAVPPGPSAAEK